MELSFNGKTLRRQLLEPKAAEWASDQALEVTQALIADLLAASTLLDVPVGVPDLSQVEPGNFELSAGEGVALRCSVSHARPPTTADGRPDWPHVHRLKVQSLEVR
jgi:hypothetical protein